MSEEELAYKDLIAGSSAEESNELSEKDDDGDEEQLTG